jgi:hypothetical protein
VTAYAATLAALVPDCDPRHVEAYMRLERRTLDDLSRCAFAELARDCASAVRLDVAAAEALAQSFGFAAVAHV